ncbi:hypothetical protein HPB49_016501 [Dermacentor silvarum]|uniref:Uncharacterized protein n=1 Tax=Dermacentor silvarum TaxID=543639 RepID=A0ACB8D6K6_DERSI|nr:hypothetical protein HPB49_016501 [Dermacentor silvarum]
MMRARRCIGTMTVVSAVLGEREVPPIHVVFVIPGCRTPAVNLTSNELGDALDTLLQHTSRPLHVDVITALDSNSHKVVMLLECLRPRMQAGVSAVAHRYRRICSDEKDFQCHAKELRTALVAKHYPEHIVDDAISRAQALDRNEILTGSKPRHPKNQTNLILTYSSTLPHVNNILAKHFNIIQQSTRLSSIFTEPP